MAHISVREAAKLLKKEGVFGEKAASGEGQLHKWIRMYQTGNEQGLRATMRNKKEGYLIDTEDLAAFIQRRKADLQERACAWVGCEKVFLPVRADQVFCSDLCRNKGKVAKRSNRLEQGLCTVCGDTMDYPASHHHNKQSPVYCSKCQERFRENYQKRKASVEPEAVGLLQAESS